MIRKQGTLVRLVTGLLIFALLACETGPTTGPLPSAQLSISTLAAPLFEGQELPLRALTRTTSGSLVSADSLGISLRWTSSDPTVARVDAQGHVTGLHDGDTDITVTGGGTTATTRVSVVPGPETLEFTEQPDSTGVVGEDLGSGIQVIVRDRHGQALSGVPLNTYLGPSSGSTTPVLPITGSDGLARLNWVLDTLAGFQSLKVHGGFQPLETVEAGNGIRPEPIQVIRVVVAPGPTARVQVVPASVSLATGTSVEIAAVTRDLYGNATDSGVTWSTLDASVASVDAVGRIVAVGEGATTISVQSGAASATVAVTVAQTPPPGTVSDLTVSSTSADGASLSFTEVGDGTGSPARYQIRFYPAPLGEGWGAALPVEEGSCAGVLVGTAAGTSRACTVEGLGTDTDYDFQLVPYRGSLDGTAVFGELSNVASARTAPGGPQGSLSITPRGPSLQPGGVATLSLAAADPNGLPIASPTVTWTTSNSGVATVSNMGQITAKAVGTAWIAAAALCCTSDSVLVDVNDGGGDPPPGSWPNEPSGIPLLADKPWNSLSAGDWGHEKWSPPPSDVLIVQDASDPISPGNVLEHRYGQGMPDGNQPGVNTFYTAKRELYVGAYWKADPNWDQHPNRMKLFHYYFEGSSANAFVSWQGDEFEHPDPMKLTWYLTGWGGLISSKAAAPRVNPGEWVLIEMHLKVNDPGTSNGFLRLWVNGTLSSEASNLSFPGALIQEFNVSGTYGGGGPPVPHTQWIRIGHTRVNGR